MIEALPIEVYRTLAFAYSQGFRQYHTIYHASAVSGMVFHHQRHFKHPKEAHIAALFHDAFYDVSKQDNEEKSAELALSCIRQWDLQADPLIVEDLILQTKNHDKDMEFTPDQALFLDCDIHVFAESASTYDVYEAGVAAEYMTVWPELHYKTGRKMFLKSLLKKPIFKTPHFNEVIARMNVTRSLASLE